MKGSVTCLGPPIDDEIVYVGEHVEMIIVYSHAEEAPVPRSGLKAIFVFEECM